MQAVWRDSFVEESNLTQTVFMLRKALGESSNQRYILTVQGRGYRFAPEVKAVTATGHTSGTLSRAVFDRENSSASVADVLPAPRRISARISIMLGICTLCATAVFLGLFSEMPRG